jgi:hypothetical protein
MKEYFGANLDKESGEAFLPRLFIRMEQFAFVIRRNSRKASEAYVTPTFVFLR